MRTGFLLSQRNVGARIAPGRWSIIQGKRIVHFGLFLCLLLAVTGCASDQERVRTSTAETTQAGLKRIAVVPFQRLLPDDSGGRAVRCPICGTMYPSCELPQNAEMVVQDVFLEKFSSRKQWTLIPADRTAAVYARVSAQDLKDTTTEELQKVGKELEADGVVIGYVSCFRERKGYAFSAERPASVTFGVYMVRVSDGTLVWGKIFDRTQQSLTENLFQATFFKRPKWLTARELSEDGVDELLASFPGAR
jgi:hypothetical protein